MSEIKHTLKVVTDASVTKVSGKYKGRAGILLLDGENKLKYFDSTCLGNVTSNEGEYQALLQGVTLLAGQAKNTGKNLSEIRVELYTDSRLIFSQMDRKNGSNPAYKTKKSSFMRIQKEIRKQCRPFGEVKIFWHSREQDLAMLADFGSKHPRRTKSIGKKFQNEPIGKALDKAVKLLLKDEEKAAEKEIE